MPNHKAPSSLRRGSLIRVCDGLLDAIFKIEVSSFTPITAGLSKDWKQQLEDLLDLLPSAILKDILSESIDRYCLRCNSSSQTPLAPAILLNQFSQRSYNEPDESGDVGCRPMWQDNQMMVPSLSKLFSNLVIPKLTKLDFSGLHAIGTVSPGAFEAFHNILSEILPKIPDLTELVLSSRHSRTSLPQCKNEHLAILGSKCPKLIFLDISFIRSINAEGLRKLLPDTDHPGCVQLQKLYIFDCTFHYNDVARVIVHLPELVDLGFNETGKVIKQVYKRNQETGSCHKLKLRLLNNMGSKTKRLIVSTFRFKLPFTQAVVDVAPEVENLKIRVTDADVQHLTALEHVRSVEFVYNVGPSTHCPGLGTTQFFEVKGSHLSSVALICNNMNMSTLKILGANCPGLSQLWCRSNYFNLSGSGREELSPEFPTNHNFFFNLKVLYMRVGECELSVTHFPDYILPYILKNASNLNELIIAIRSTTFDDSYMAKLLTDCSLHNLEKLMIVVPGLNNLTGILKLTDGLVSFIFQFCPNIKKLGNLLSWSVTPEEADEIISTANANNFDIEIMYRKMIMR